MGFCLPTKQLIAVEGGAASLVPVPRLYTNNMSTVHRLQRYVCLIGTSTPEAV